MNTKKELTAAISTLKSIRRDVKGRLDLETLTRLQLLTQKLEGILDQL